MSQYFGNIRNAETTQLRFDRVYANRKTMEDCLAEGDGVFLGRFVLVLYEDTTRPRRLGYSEKSLSSSDELIEIATDKTCSVYYKHLADSSTGYGVCPGDLFYVNSGVYYFYYICTNQISENGNALFQQISFILAHENDTVRDYTLNYQIDKEAYPNMTGDGYDSTLWRKAIVNGVEQYQLIATLSTILPQFSIEADAPSITPVAPHFGEYSTNKNYSLHLQSNWGLQIGEAEDGEPSDLDVKYEFLEYDPDEDRMVAIKKEYPGQLYYNKDGFDSLYNNHKEDLETEISLLPTGKSGKLYYDHARGDYTEQYDIQQLKFHIPEIGNAAAHMWNLIYGEGEELASGQRKRNQNISWGNITGLRLVDVDNESGGYTYSTENLKTLAGCLNSAHDLMGPIIVDSTKQTITMDNAAANRIYYGDPNSTGKNGYYFKDIAYTLKSFEEAGIENSEEWVGGRIYQDLIQFEPGKYYTYEDGDFYKEYDTSPEKDVPYYLLGEGKLVTLKRWQPLDEKTNEIIYYYYKDMETLDYWKDTRDVPDETQTYYEIQVTTATAPGHIQIYNPTDFIELEDVTALKDDETSEYVSAEVIEDFNVQAIYSGYFYWDTDSESLIKVSAGDEYKPSVRYYLITEFAKVQSQDIDNNLVSTLYLIEDENTLVSFAAVTPDSALLNEYSITLLEMKDNTYYYEGKQTEDPYLEGYRCLHLGDPINDDWTYYTIQELSQETSFEDGEYFYKENLFFTKTAAEDFILSTALGYDEDTDYYRITYHPDDIKNYRKAEGLTAEDYADGAYYVFVKETNSFVLSKEEFSNFTTYYYFDEIIPKIEDTDAWNLNPIQENFYEAGKYYYYSWSEDTDKLDYSETMKTWEHEDVNLSYVDDQYRVYYLLNIAYVVSDTSGNLTAGFVWDKTSAPPSTVTLGIREEGYQWTELTGFSRSLNTINGLILQINKFFKFDDKITRELDTMAGNFNKIKDITRSFAKFEPGEIVVVDDYGRLISKTTSLMPIKGYDSLLDRVEYEDFKTNTSSLRTSIAEGDTLGIALKKLEARIAALENG